MSRERGRINHGDIIELIPGHYFFKYASLATEKKSSSPNKDKRTLKESSELCEGEVQCVKRKRQVSDDEALARKLQVLSSDFISDVMKEKSYWKKEK